MDERRHELDLVLVGERARTGLRDRLQQVRMGRFADTWGWSVRFMPRVSVRENESTHAEVAARTR